MLRHYFRRAGERVTQILYARRRFKLLMRTSFREIDLRLQAVAAATNFFSTVVRPVVISAPFGKSVLIVAPHQDDEVIGCGGAMALQRRSGAALQVVVLQDGADEHEQMSMTRDTLREMRNAESRAAARVIDGSAPLFLGHNNLRRESAAIESALMEIIRQKRIDAIFTPFVLDGNPDHRECNVILGNVLRQVAREMRIFQYEVWANCVPNVVVIVDEVMQQKIDMLSCFRFANDALDYTHATTGLNMFHSILLPAGAARYVEAYFETPREEFVELVAAVARAGSGDASSGQQKVESH